MASKFPPKKSHDDILAMLTGPMVSAMEGGQIPWIRPWTSLEAMNAVSKKEYRGFNRLILNFVGSMKFKSPYWLTFNQAKDLGGTVKKGEKSIPVVFWKRLPPRGSKSPKVVDSKEDETEAVEGDAKPASGRSFTLLRYYNVFNADQCEGLQVKFDLHPKARSHPSPSEAHKAAEALVKNANICPIHERGNRAVYSPTLDEIGIPPREQFDSLDDFYHSLFHEMAHATGHEKRLNRIKRNDDFIGSMSRGSYAREELVAEIASTLMACDVGLATDAIVRSSVAYLQGWAKKCRQDPNLLVVAAQQAQKARDWCLGIELDEVKESEDKDAPSSNAESTNPAPIEVQGAPLAPDAPAFKPGDMVLVASDREPTAAVITDAAAGKFVLNGLHSVDASAVMRHLTREEAERAEIFIFPDGSPDEAAVRSVTESNPHLNLEPIRTGISQAWIAVKRAGVPVKSISRPSASQPEPTPVSDEAVPHGMPRIAAPVIDEPRRPQPVTALEEV